MELIKTFTEFQIGERENKLKSIGRDLLIRLLSGRHSIASGKNWISFPYYHHVFDDERKNFERQLKYLQNFGEFISLDDASTFLSGKVKMDGRYFCLSFDDGYRNLYYNMMPVTDKLNIPVIIYLPTDFIGLNENNAEDVEKLRANRPNNPKLLSFLNWAQCKEMLLHNVSFGSHTKTHANLKQLSSNEIEFELSTSKKIIEENLGIACKHFACPWGKVHINFEPSVTEPILKKLGYETLTTTNRGKNFLNTNLFSIKRDHVLASFGNYELKYFFGK